MKEIGEKLKQTRESVGIPIEEAAEDLKLRVSQIENIEEGKIEAFKDIFFLKYFIRDYAKYLGLDHEELVDEFNEYLFDYTSKISIDDIKKAKQKADKKNKKNKSDMGKIISPYTIAKNNRIKLPKIIKYIIIAIIIFVMAYFLYEIFTI